MKLFFERYIKLAHIGKGANAHVYKVRHAELGYVRAIKILNEYIESKGERTYQSFLKECKTLLAIGNGAHPNIIRIYGPDLIDNRAIVEMDYVQGMTLDSYIKDKGFLDYEEVKTFIHDIVGALAYTHHDIYKFLMNPEEDDLQPDPIDGQKYVITPEKEAELVRKYGIAHNDLHSNNVMRRDYDGSFVLLDFGLAVQDGKCIKSSRMADGNPEYQAPEKFDSETVSPRSDVYSLGILMYEVLAGRVPFEIQLDSDGKISQRAVNIVLNQHQSATPPPILPFRKTAFEKHVPCAIYERDYPKWLDGIIMKCLSKKPEERYADAKELLDVINCHMSEEAISIHEINQLKVENKRLTQSLVESEERYYELKKNDIQTNLDSNEISGLELDNDTINKGKKKWMLASCIAFALLIGVSIWGYCMSLNYKAAQLRFDNFQNEAIGKGFFDSYNGIWMTEQSAPNEVINDSVANYIQPQVSTNTKTEYRTPPEVQKELDRLKKENINLKSQAAGTKTKVEYRTPPEVQQEINRLKIENRNLRGQVERFLQTIQK